MHFLVHCAASANNLSIVSKSTTKKLLTFFCLLCILQTVGD